MQSLLLQLQYAKNACTVIILKNRIMGTSANIFSINIVSINIVSINILSIKL